MARRRTTKRPTRRRKTFSVTNFVFSLAYANVLSEGLFGTSIAKFFLGFGGKGNTYGGAPAGIGHVRGPGIGIRELLTDGTSIAAVIDNAQNNLLDMAMKSIMLGVTQKIFKKALRAPLRQINANLVKPLLGSGVRM